MRRFLVCLLACGCSLLLGGCSLAAIPLPNGKTAYVARLLDDDHFRHAETRADSTIVLEDYQAAVNAQATAAVMQMIGGVLLRLIVPIP